MTAAEALATIAPVIREVLDRPDLEITPSLTARDVPEWDSLANITIIIEVERAFAIKFTSDELAAFADTGAMAAAAAAKQGG
ncbi:acyl carrier protein [Desertibaculum subflavum]|uniref:acyl carrier protein n=1 Tax=Desertibaculum subflavum TaxID=2268458 RepID=UPI000E675D15